MRSRAGRDRPAPDSKHRRIRLCVNECIDASPASTELKVQFRRLRQRGGGVYSFKEWPSA
jgi:hypothetical protein